MKLWNIGKLWLIVRSFAVCILMSCAGCGTDASNVARHAPTSERIAFDPLGVEKAVSELNTATYAEIIENEFLRTLDIPQSTFAIDVDTASYSNVRRFVQRGELPPKGAVRIEELINYFTYSFAEPAGEHPLAVHTEIADCPWQAEHRLLRIGLKGKSLIELKRPACNLVFLIDVSGSMMQVNKLPLVKQSLKLLVKQLNAEDRLSLVVYAGDAGVVLPSTSVTNIPDIIAAIDSLKPGGSTNGSAGIQLAYDIAAAHRIPGGVNRVILCTDGDFNVGTTDESELVALITEKAKSGTFLSVLGFGDNDLQDRTMEKLADRGDGNYACIDNLMEARKALVQQVGGTLVTIAKDVKIQIDFNPRHVQSYRLIGYENRALANRDFRDDSKDAGELGAGHTVTAFYEIVPSGTESVTAETRRAEFVTTSLSSEADASTMLTVNVRYKHPTQSEGTEFQLRLPADTDTNAASEDFQFASAVAAYGMLLRESKFCGAASWDWVISTAEQSTGKDPNGLRNEFVQLAKAARSITLAKSNP